MIQELQNWAPAIISAIVLQGGIIVVAWGRELQKRRRENEPDLNIPKEDWDYIMSPPVIGPVCNSDYDNYYFPHHSSCGFIMRQRLDSEILGEGTFR